MTHKLFIHVILLSVAIPPNNQSTQAILSFKTTDHRACYITNTIWHVAKEATLFSNTKNIRFKLRTLLNESTTYSILLQWKLTIPYLPLTANWKLWQIGCPEYFVAVTDIQSKNKWNRKERAILRSLFIISPTKEQNYQKKTAHEHDNQLQGYIQDGSRSTFNTYLGLNYCVSAHNKSSGSITWEDVVLKTFCSMVYLHVHYFKHLLLMWMPSH